jgi:hypothetical protein
MLLKMRSRRVGLPPLCGPILEAAVEKRVPLKERGKIRVISMSGRSAAW